MVGRIYIPLECVRFINHLSGDVPVLRVKLVNLLGEEFGLIDILVDTGFAGSVMLERDDYEFFSIGELPRDFWRSYRTLAGPLLVRTARAFIDIGGKRIETYVEAPYFGLGKRVMGREVLRKIALTLDGLNGETCIVSAREE